MDLVRNVCKLLLLHKFSNKPEVLGNLQESIWRTCNVDRSISRYPISENLSRGSSARTCSLWTSSPKHGRLK